MTGMSAKELRAILTDTATEFGVTGAQTALVIAGEPVHAATGIANFDLGTPVTDDTVFQIGSTTKVWTAVLLMQLVDRGLVDLDEPVTTYLPDIDLAAGDERRSITPRRLMSMSSGLDNGPYARSGRGDDCIVNYVRMLGDVPLVFSPGSAYGYSNASTNVTGLIIERLTGLSWDDALKRHIVEPGGFAEVVSLFEDLPYFRVAVGKNPGVPHAHRPWHFGRGMGPTGSTLATSARDLARFGAMFLRGGVPAGGDRVLSESAVATMQTPQIAVPPAAFATSWCAGPYHLDWDGIDVFGHVGTSENGASVLRWIPELDISMAVVHNTISRTSEFIGAVYERVLRDRLGVPIPPPPKPGSYEIDDLRPYVGRYVALGREYEVNEQDGALVLTAHREVGFEDGERPWEKVSSIIRPTGPHRFAADDPVVTWNYGWELAFTVDDDQRATVFHNGAFAARRVD